MGFQGQGLGLGVRFRFGSECLCRMSSIQWISLRLVLLQSVLANKKYGHQFVNGEWGCRGEDSQTVPGLSNLIPCLAEGLEMAWIAAQSGFGNLRNQLILSVFFLKPPTCYPGCRDGLALEGCLAFVAYRWSPFDRFGRVSPVGAGLGWSVLNRIMLHQSQRRSRTAVAFQWAFSISLRCFACLF